LENKTADRYDLWAGALVVLLHFLLIMRFHQPAFSTLDAHGYQLQTKLIATTGKTYFRPDSDLLFIGYTWSEAENGNYRTIWPPGYPLALATVYRLAGPEAALYVDALLASLVVLAVFLLCRAWAGPGWGAIGAAVAATNPFLNLHTQYRYPHIFVAFLFLWGLYLLDRWLDKGGAVRAAAAGLLFGAMTGGRYFESLFFAPVVLFAAAELRSRGRPLRALLPLLAGASLPIAAMMIYNHVSFGSVFNTNYSRLNMKAGGIFDFVYFRNHIMLYFRNLAAEGAGPAFALGIVGFGAAAVSAKHRRKAILLFSVIVIATVGYASYFTFPNTLQSMRFLLPTFPLYAIGCAWLLKSPGRESKYSVAVPALVLISVISIWGFSKSAERLERLSHRNRVLVQVKTTIDEHVPRGSVIIAGEYVGQYLDYFEKWKIASGDGMNRTRRDVRNDLRSREIRRDFTDAIWEWAENGPGDGEVFWIADEGTGKIIADSLPAGHKLEKVAEVRLRRPRETRFDDLPPGQLNRLSRMNRHGFHPEWDNNPESIFNLMYFNLTNRSPVVLYRWIAP